MTYWKFTNKNTSWIDNLRIMVFFVLAVFLPDFVIGHICHLPIKIEMVFLFGVILFGLLLSATNKFVFLFFVSVIVLIQIIQLHFMAYFGSPIEPSNIMNLFRETKDIFDVSYLKHTWFVLPILVVCFGVLIYYFFKSKPIKIPFVWLILFYLAAHKPYRAYSETKGIWYFQPSLTRPSLKNSISTFSYFFFQYWPKGYQNLTVEYQPYELTDTSSDVQNILLIWGESLYAGHMPMFGYERNTFPLLSHITEQKGWQKSLGISGGIATATSTLLFFNVAREPANTDILKTHVANLFQAAKNKGFHTYYLSNQESRLTMGLQTSAIDEIITNDTNPIYFAKYKDEGLINILKEKGLKGKKNFIVLHMRSPHSPYENRYKGREAEFEKYTPAATSKDRFEYETNTYDNALLYTDMVISQMVQSFEKLALGTNYDIFITADHGQLFDYQGMWGHNNLVLEQAKVPFFVKSFEIKDLPSVISHYQIGKLILTQIGFELKNKNENNNTYYLHGNNIDFPYDFIEYRIENENVIFNKLDNTKNLLPKSSEK
ncbi:MAG: sulfatase-like hydrolase/transferase [Alphaproteobacteria bacterium]|nr:sulfatase-like hydrolase/transferase [Alphaproteobacteria bacterium]